MEEIWVDDKYIAILNEHNLILNEYFNGKLEMPYIQDIFLLDTNISGTFYAEIEDIEPNLYEGEILKFIREPKNEFDELAIKILDSNDNKLGYVPKKENKVIARLMDSGKVIYGKINKKSKIHHWIDIKISIYMKDF